MKFLSLVLLLAPAVMQAQGTQGNKWDDIKVPFLNNQIQELNEVWKTDGHWLTSDLQFRRAKLGGVSSIHGLLRMKCGEGSDVKTNVVFTDKWNFAPLDTVNDFLVLGLSTTNVDKSIELISTKPVVQHNLLTFIFSMLISGCGEVSKSQYSAINLWSNKDYSGYRFTATPVSAEKFEELK